MNERSNILSRYRDVMVHPKYGDVAGEVLVMGNGERWFHPYNGGQPIRL